MAENTDYYGDGSPNPGVPAKAPTEEMAPEDSNVALLPKSFFPADKDLKPGSECKVRVEEVREDQVLVSYARESEGEEEAAPEAAPAPPMGGGMAEMMA